MFFPLYTVSGGGFSETPGKAKKPSNPQLPHQSFIWPPRRRATNPGSEEAACRGRPWRYGTRTALRSRRRRPSPPPSGRPAMKKQTGFFTSALQESGCNGVQESGVRGGAETGKVKRCLAVDTIREKLRKGDRRKKRKPVGLLRGRFNVHGEKGSREKTQKTWTSSLMCACTYIVSKSLSGSCSCACCAQGEGIYVAEATSFLPRLPPPTLSPSRGHKFLFPAPPPPPTPLHLEDLFSVGLLPFPSPFRAIAF